MFCVRDLTVDYLKEAMGVSPRPQFGWKLAGGGRGIRQSAFAFELARDADFTCVLFESGVVESDESAHYAPENLPLEAARRYFWRVRARDQRGGAFLFHAALLFALEVRDKTGHGKHARNRLPKQR